MLVEKISIDKIGELEICIKEDGTFYTISDSNKNFEFILVFRQLDSQLISNIIYHHSSVGNTIWTYDFKLSHICDYFHSDIHPGFKIEIYDKNDNDRKDKIFEKYFHKSKRYKCLDLKSFDIDYPPFYLFFNQPDFISSFTLNSNDVVYDLGANVGAFALASSNYNVKQIYAFEPNNKTFTCLKENCDRYARNVQCFNKAISSDFNTFYHDCNISSQEFGYYGFDKNFKEGYEIVNTINLEKFVYVNNLELPTYIKVDIEGHEYDFFENTSEDFFKNTHTIFLEFHHNNGTNLKKIINKLINLNFKLKIKSESVLETPMNTVFFYKK